MIADLIAYLEGVIVHFGAWGVFFASIVEEIIAPLPSPVVMMSSGFFLMEGPVNSIFFSKLFLTIALPYAFGVLFGSFVIYTLARYFGKPLIVRWGGWFNISWDNIDKIRAKFRSSYTDEIGLFTLRVIPIIPSAALAAACGLVRMKIWKYSLITVLGVFIRASIFGFLGWYAGEAYYRYAEYVGNIERFSTILFIFLIIVILSYFFYKKRSSV